MTWLCIKIAIMWCPNHCISCAHFP
jgi:hypothetical protein